MQQLLIAPIPRDVIQSLDLLFRGMLYSQPYSAGRFLPYSAGPLFRGMQLLIAPIPRDVIQSLDLPYSATQKIPTLFRGMQ